MVFDSSVLVAALVTPNPASVSRIILAAAAAGAVRLVVSDALEEEYRRAVEYPQVVRYSPKVNRQAFVSAVVAQRTESFPETPGDSWPETLRTTWSWRRRSGGARNGSSAWTGISSISRRSRVSGSSAPAISSSS